MVEKSMHIGEVAEQIGLSLRTIRYYEEVGLITPSGRTNGGFRLYTVADTTRLQVLKDMKPLGFSLDEMRDLLGILDYLEEADTDSENYREMVARLAVYRQNADARCGTLRKELRIAESFAGKLGQRLAGHQPENS